MQYSDDTIVALSTPVGAGAIGVIRISGQDAIHITQKIFQGKNLLNQPTHTAHFGYILDGNVVIDEVVATVFLAPKSYTNENTVELSCHGSAYIIDKIIKLLLKNGGRYARAGEFTQRAFMNGRFDLAQAEAVADLISSDSESAHLAAMNQMRGGFSLDIKILREKLVNFASLIELELDFAEEDVEFANRENLKQLVYRIVSVLTPLIKSFDLGNVIKSGIPIVIIGKPNSGKSTLLNALLNEEKAMVSSIPGTTRDVIEDEINIEGIKFRFIDTAGLRETEDVLEAMGIERTRHKIKEASLIMYLFDVSDTSISDLEIQLQEFEDLEIPILMVGNKIDQVQDTTPFTSFPNIVLISAAKKIGIANLTKKLVEEVNVGGFKTGSAMVTNIRHYESLVNTQNALTDVLNGLDNGATGDFLAMDIRQSLHYLGLITGAVTNDEILGNIFSKFCIGK